MIKWAGYGKLLKLSFFGLLISFFTLFVGSSASAGRVQVIGLESSPSFVDSNYNLTFLKGGGLLTNYLGQGKGILAIDNNALFWWTPNGQPYFYDPSFQGFFGEFWSCDELTGLDSVPSNCSSSPIDGDYVNLFKAFFNKVVIGDYSYYDFVSYNNVSTNGYSYGRTINVCWSSHEIGKSLCFRYSYCAISQGSSCIGRNYGSLSGSQNYEGLTFSNLPYSSIGVAPGQNGYLGVYEGTDGSSSSGSIDTTLTGNVLFEECTNGSVKTLVESRGMSPYMCYGGLPIDSNGVAVPVAGTGASVFEIYQNSSDGKNFKDWFDYWDNIYDNRYVYDSSIRSGTPAPLYSYFEIYNQYGPQWNALYVENYCRIIVNDLPLNGKFTGISSWCLHSQPVYGSDDNNIVDGNIPIGTNWDGVGNISGNNQKSALVFIQDFFNLAKSKVPTNFNDIGGGFLPTYIIMFLLAIILFRFLMH